MFIAQMNLYLLKQLQISQPGLLIGQEHYLTNRLSWSNVFVFITTIIKHHLEFDLWETQLILISFGLNYKEIRCIAGKQIKHFYSTSNVALTSIKVPGRPGVSTPITVSSSVFGTNPVYKWRVDFQNKPIFTSVQ